MGAFKIIKRSPAPGLGRKPYKREKATPPPHNPAYPPLPPKRFWPFITTFTILLSLGAAGFFRPQTTDSRPPVTMAVGLQIRAIDSGGHPVAGAVLSLSGKPLGVSDSFGEWRRSLPLKPAQELPLKIRKDGGKEGALVGERLLVVPAAPLPVAGMEVGPGQDEVRMHVSVRLYPAGDRDPQDSPPPPGQSPRTERLGADLEASSVEAEVLGSPLVASAAQEELDPYYQIWFTALNLTEQEAGASPWLGLELLPALRKLAQQQGLVVSRQSPWQVGLGWVPVAAAAGKAALLRVVTKSTRQRTPVDFLVAAGSSPKQTAARILKLLKWHTPKPYSFIKRGEGWFVQDLVVSFWRIDKNLTFVGPLGRKLGIKGARPVKPGLFAVAAVDTDLCGPKASNCMLSRSHLPQHASIANWQKFIVRIPGVSSARAQVYVGGIKATPAGDELWHYWSLPAHRAYLSILRQGQIEHRQMLEVPRDHSTLTLAVRPSGSQQY